MSFLIPASMDMATVHNLLERLTGGKVTVNTIKPHYEHIHQGTITEKYIIQNNMCIMHINVLNVLHVNTF